MLSNIGYARGISGALGQHIARVYRHIYCAPRTQRKALRQLSAIMNKEDPDVCCFIEIDEGSFSSGGCNQLAELASARHPWGAIANKYAPSSAERSFLVSKTFGNAFVAKTRLAYEKIYFAHGVKRLVYRIHLEKRLTLFFAHFSLNERVRRRQFAEARKLMDSVRGDVIFMGDFNILSGAGELAPLISDRKYALLNSADQPTFTFDSRRLMLDLCIVSARLAPRARLKVIPQPYSDHAALVLRVSKRRKP